MIGFYPALSTLMLHVYQVKYIDKRVIDNETISPLLYVPKDNIHDKVAKNSMIFLYHNNRIYLL